MGKKLVLATRKSPLALAQAHLVADHLRERCGAECELLKVVTTGDQQAEWSLEAKGGKGLFTRELEQALLRGDADAAVHSAKDLPGETVAGLVTAGYLPREDPRDTLVLREGVTAPATLATGSPRRRHQAAMLFPNLEFTEIRGNVDTRLRKIGEQKLADGTFLPPRASSASGSPPGPASHSTPSALRAWFPPWAREPSRCSAAPATRRASRAHSTRRPPRALAWSGRSRPRSAAAATRPSAPTPHARHALFLPRGRGP